MNKVDKAIDLLISEDEPLFSNPLVFDDAWLDNNTEDWTRRPDGKIDVLGSIQFSSLNMDKIPYDFGKVSEGFYCSGNNLTSLEGSPEEVGEHFYCAFNKLTNLVGGPKKVEAWFDCGGNNITSLEGAPEYIGRAFYCDQFDEKDYRQFIKERDG